jgi:hypothetical protein
MNFGDREQEKTLTKFQTTVSYRRWPMAFVGGVSYRNSRLVQFSQGQFTKAGKCTIERCRKRPRGGARNIENQNMNTNHSRVTKSTGRNINWTICTSLIAAAFLVTGCGQKVSGVNGIYKPVNDTSIIRALDFTPDGKVVTSAVIGNESDTYVVDGNQVKISEGGNTEVFTIDPDGSLDGGTDLGKFVKQQ